jgi:hypothetical protein
MCRACPAYATSGNGSTALSNCSCEVGYDVGDGETRTVFADTDVCTVTIEVRIVTAGQNALQCLSHHSPPAEYCDSNAGSRNDVWVRVQWAVGTQSPVRFNAFGFKIDSGYSRSEVFLPLAQRARIDALTSQFNIPDASWVPASTSAVGGAADDQRMPTSVLACNVVFPANLSQGVLWQTWGLSTSPAKISKAWIGIRECLPTIPACNNRRFFYLRVRAGQGDVSIDPQVDVHNTSIKDSGQGQGKVVWIDTTNFPRDDAQHQIVVQVASRPLRLRLWIDSKEIGTHAVPAALDQLYDWTTVSHINAQPVARGSYGVYLAPSGTVGVPTATGEPSAKWPGSLPSELRVYVRTIWAGCSGSLLDGDWLFDALNHLAVYCPPVKALDDEVWSSWYALYHDAIYDYEVPVEPGRGFDFAAGKSTVALFTGIPGGVLGAPIAIEYYVSGSDAWRPASIGVRFPTGVPRYNISNSSFITRSELCWVDSDGQQYNQSALGCPFVGQSAKATLLEPQFSPKSSGAVAVGLYSAPRTPDSVYALLAEDRSSREGSRLGGLLPGAARYLLQSEVNKNDFMHLENGGRVEGTHRLDVIMETHRNLYDEQVREVL